MEGARTTRDRLGAVRRLVAGALPGRKATDMNPLLSVVILGGGPGSIDTLDAVLAQKLTRLEVFLSGKSAAGPCGDKRLHIVAESGTQESLRAVRGRARGRYLVVVPAGAIPSPTVYGRIVEVLENTGDLLGSAPAPRNLKSARAHANSTVRDAIDYLGETRDMCLWTKVMRRDLWEEITGHDAFNTSSTEELVDALLLSIYQRTKKLRLVDVSAGTDSGQPPAPSSGLDGLSLLLRRCTAASSGRPGHGPAIDERVLGAWLGGLVNGTWVDVCRQIPRQPEAYADLSLKTARLLLADAEAVLNDVFRFHDRVLLRLCAQGRWEDLSIVLAELQDQGPGVAIAPGKPVCGDPSYLPLLTEPLPSQLLRLGSADVELQTQLTGFAWSGSILTLSGRAQMEGLSDDTAPPSISALLRNAVTGETHSLDAALRADSESEERSRDAWNARRCAGFSVVVETAQLRPTPGSGSEEWAVELTIYQAGFARSSRIVERDGDLLGARLDVGPVSADSRRTVGLFDRTRGLRLVVLQYRFVAVDIRMEGLTLYIRLAGAASSLRLEGSGGTFITMDPEDDPERQLMPGPSTFATVLSASILGGEESFRVTASDAAGRQQAVGWAGTSREACGSELDRLQPEITGFGFLQLAVRSERMLVESWHCSEDGLVLAVQGFSNADFTRTGATLVLKGDRRSFTARSTFRAEGQRWRFDARFDLSACAWGYGIVAPPPGTYALYLERSGEHLLAVPASAGFGEQDLEYLGRRLRLRAVTTGPALKLKLLRPYRPSERGSRNRRLLVEAYHEAQTGLEDAVLFESFGGKDGGDSLRPLHDQLRRHLPSWDRYWSVEDYSVPVPKGVEPLLRYSQEWFRILATARLVICNDTFPPFFRKRKGQFYLQTWHGTPLKKIGLDTPTTRLTPSYRRTLTREPQSWDLLLAQSPFAAETLRASFRYTGPLLVEGYPRNDILLSVQAQQARDATRRSLGLEDGQTVVLYMPTWRDDLQDKSGRSTFPSYLDTRLLHETLGPDYVTLVRGHHRTIPTSLPKEGALDVSDFPEASLLYLAADVLVTDYSSAMFDFCLTGKPIVFFVPDEETYRKEVRGFYFDFAEHAPGPLVRDTQALCAALLRGAAHGSEPVYEDFRRRYAGSESGRAAQLVAEYLRARLAKSNEPATNVAGGMKHHA